MEFQGPDGAQGPEQQPSEVDLVRQVEVLLHSLLEASRVLFLRFQQRALQLAVVLCLLGLLLWMAVFLYGSFYYSYMPTASYSTPVHFYYSSDCQSSAVCSFPMANVSLQRKNYDQVMTYGQPYRITLELEMPDSPTNQNLGMFMVRMSSYGRDGAIINTAARSTMLHYRSFLLQMMATVLLSPLLLSGATEQKQSVTIELFTDYTENSYYPTSGAVIELQSHRVQVYSAHLYIHAHFSGIRYVLFTFPVLSALLGVSSTFGFLSIIILFSSLQYSWNSQTSRSRVRHRSRMRNSREERPVSEEPADVTADLTESYAEELTSRYKIFTDEPSYCKTTPLLQEPSDPLGEACDGLEESIPEGAGVSEPEPQAEPEVPLIQEEGAEGQCGEDEEEEQQMGIKKAELEESSSIPEVSDSPEPELGIRCIIS